MVEIYIKYTVIKQYNFIDLTKNTSEKISWKHLLML